MVQDTFDLSLNASDTAPSTRGGGSQLARVSPRASNEMLGDKLSREQADLLYKPLGESSENYSITTLFEPEGGQLTLEDIVLSESLYNFDQLVSIGSDEQNVIVESQIQYVNMIMLGLELTGDDRRMVVWNGGTGGYWYSRLSEDGLTLTDHFRGNRLWGIYGVNLG